MHKNTQPFYSTMPQKITEFYSQQVDLSDAGNKSLES